MPRQTEPSPAQLRKARARFDQTGVTIAAFADELGVSRKTAYEVLSGRKKCVRGDAHKVAVALGLKQPQAHTNSAVEAIRRAG